MTKKMFWFSLLLVAILVACGGTAEPAAKSQPAQTPAPAQDEDAAAATGKPQLVEFYADW